MEPLLAELASVDPADWTVFTQFELASFIRRIQAVPSWQENRELTQWFDRLLTRYLEFARKQELFSMFTSSGLILSLWVGVIALVRTY